MHQVSTLAWWAEFSRYSAHEQSKQNDGHAGVTRCLWRRGLCLHFQDLRVQKRLADLGFRLKSTRMGSRDMAARLVKGETPEFLYASGVVAGNQIVDAAKKAGVPATMVSPIHTPMVIAS